MGRIKGCLKTGGRVKGTPNSKTLILSEILDGLNYDVPANLIETLKILEPDKQADVLLELMSYLYPKRKALEVTGADGGAIQINSVNHLSSEERNKRINDLIEKQNADK